MLLWKYIKAFKINMLTTLNYMKINPKGQKILPNMKKRSTGINGKEIKTVVEWDR